VTEIICKLQSIVVKVEAAISERVIVIFHLDTYNRLHLEWACTHCTSRAASSA